MSYIVLVRFLIMMFAHAHRQTGFVLDRFSPKVDTDQHFWCKGHISMYKNSSTILISLVR